MNPERWQQIKEAFQTAVELPPGEERAAFVARACGADASMRERVESLLAAHERAEGFIESPAYEGLAESLAGDEARQEVDRRIGHYRIVREIGRGGMGAVYLAERDDGQYDQRVALKLIKRGMDTDFILARFRHERQVLATLDHPHIARLLDGGTTDDELPYLVMEHVEGRAVDEYCDALRLDTVARLKLFRLICAAVQYAHQRLVIHRDLKPSNILVNEEGAPKLLDFGIAKILDRDSSSNAEPTATALRLMTPEYASPEQAAGQPVTTASDVYSLGVLLYELLTGHRPYQLKSRAPEELARAINSSQPERPSVVVTRVEEVFAPGGGTERLTPERVSETREGRPDKLSRRLRGDLDNIVLMALRKEPERRYSSVEQFSEDIRRYLEGRPVNAREDKFGYRAGKFVRRNRAAVSAAALVALALLIGVITTQWEARRARIQQARAERRFADVRRLADSLIFDFNGAVENVPGTTQARAVLVKSALAYLDSLAQEASEDASLQRELATAYQRVGDVQGYPEGPNIGDTPGALASYRKSLEIRERLAALDPSNKELRLELATSDERVGLLLPTAEGVRMYLKALAVRESLAAADPTDLKLRRDLGANYEKVASLLGDPYWGNLGDTARALDYARKSLAVREELYRAAPSNDEARSALFDSYHILADMLWATGRLSDALQYQRRAQALMASIIAAEPANAEARREYATGVGRVAVVLEEDGQYAEALRTLRAHPNLGLDNLAAADPHNALLQRQRVTGYNEEGELLLKTGDADGALRLHRSALEACQRLMKLDPHAADARRRLANTYEDLGRALAAKGDPAEALRDSRAALDLRERLAGEDPSDSRLRDTLAANYASLGDILAGSGDPDAALDTYRKAAATYEPLVASDPPNWLARRALADLYLRMGDAETRLARGVVAGGPPRAEAAASARDHFTRAARLWQEMRAQGTLTRADAAKLEEAARRVARLDAAPAK
jgi:serine/threonine protein kinase